METISNLPNPAALKEAALLAEEGERVNELGRKIQTRLSELLRVDENNNHSTMAARLPKNRRGRRGILKQAIMKQLQRAGANGITIQELAHKLDTDSKNISAWFTLTGKKNPAIHRIRPGHYQLIPA